MTEGSSLASYTAQAIIARTYLYYQVKDDPNKIINNSGSGYDDPNNINDIPGYQVYLPYRYVGLGEDLGAVIKLERQTTVSQAITRPGARYMTYDDFDPIAAYFGADNCLWTKDGPEDYLVSVYDPISQKPNPCDNDALGTRYGGLGSAGASRWGYGSTNEYGTGGNIVTPNYRWNPLDVDWNTPGVITAPVLYPSPTYNLTVLAQNTGVRNWYDEGGPFIELAYYWETQNSLITGTNAITQTTLQPGQIYSLLDIQGRPISLPAR